ncbi:YbjQ family protein [Glycomyces xiaoerkulensis]|uniref:YbjQ family protein n=1 Tax=Glycomyces xiaoerkulensis TaxID=2038139 RepID=UPI000C264C32|nr:YbjQ family protein [Glycomyces xiaoerkulensis]
MVNIGEFGATNTPSDGFTVVTTENVPGHEITEVHGEAFGITVRARNIGSDIGSGLKSIAGGELKGLTKALVAAREQAVARMAEQAQEVGANAVVMMRFDVSDARGIGTEVCAYGTAVTVVKK